ncbi:MAG: hypothetical protein E2O29_02065 [Deltaproteobacteria bacterium]|nr:MAG: hypothetical protein E2O29_02065 [Deltaproteobacteria bacterium]
MILKFDSPITLVEAREIYNDNVKFITTIDSYPSISSIEFDNDPRDIFKRKLIAPKVTKQADKIVSRYRSTIENIWDYIFDKVKEDLKEGLEKQVTISDRRKLIARGRIGELRRRLSNEARNRFEDGFRLGKLRGQVISNQELDDSFSKTDEEIIEERLDENEVYLVAFATNLEEALDILMDREYHSFEELEEAIEEKIQEPKRARAKMYALAAFGLVVSGTVAAFAIADPKLGHFKPIGGVWTIHPNEGKGGPVCEGCLENSGRWMTIQDFDDEWGTNDCLGNCRCDHDTTARR